MWTAPLQAQRVNGFDQPQIKSETPTKPAPEPEDTPVEVPAKTGGPRVFYHSRSTSISKDLSHSIFEGDVVAIGGGTIVTADRIAVNHQTNVMEASGHVIIMTAKSVFVGDTMELYWATGDFKLTKAIMVANDSKAVDSVSQRVLGFTPEEVEFEARRQDRLREIEARKTLLRDEYREQAERQNQQSPIIDEYSLALEQEDLTRKQESPAFARMSKARRKSFETRRAFWEESQEKNKGTPVTQELYFRVSGETLERTNGNDYRAFESTWTPCKCEEGEEPAWGFRAARIEAQMEGYVDLVHPVLAIKGFPVLYLPYLKVPMKQTRQSGFLVPTLRTGDSKTGNVYTQPIYFAFAPNLDSTVTTDYFQERGTRLGVETRYQQRQYSGWSLNVESMRDRVWVEERNVRRRLEDFHRNDPQGCIATNQCTEEQLEQRLAVPNNTWRHKEEWRGQTFLAPRLSFISHGMLLSDRRYISDLSLGDSFDAIFNPTKYANAFSTAKSVVHLDGKDLYLGLTSSFGDHALMEGQRFEGLQLPWQIHTMSRTFELVSTKNFLVPIYGTTQLDYIPIYDYTPLNSPNRTVLSSGEWRRAKLTFVAPLVSDSVIRVDQFTELENRSILHKNVDDETSFIQSWRTGITFNLPIDGTGEFPLWMQPDDWKENSKGKRYLHHIMNWSLGLSARPVVVRRGVYGEVDPLTGYRMVYFASDRKEYDSSDQAATVEDSMQRHQRVTFATTHRWRTYRRGWSILEGNVDDNSRKRATKESYRQKARRELEFSMDRQIESESEMFGQSTLNENWLINRYRLDEHEANEPVNFGADMTYDFIQEELRRKQVEENRRLEAAAELATDPANKADILQGVVPYADLPRAWTGPNAGLSVGFLGLSLGSNVEYDLYLRTSRRTNAVLVLPEVIKTQLSGGYSLEKQPQFDKESGTLRFAMTRVNSVGLTTGLIPWVKTTVSLAKKNVEGLKQQYETRFGLEYFDDSECWGLRFLRSKNFEHENERQARYLLQLSIIFMGQQRAQDMSPPIDKKFRKE